MLVFFVILAFCVFFPLLWTLITFFVSRVSGWASLAKHYKTDLPAPEHTRSLQSAIIGGARYNGVLSIGINTEGIYLKPFILFSFFHPPLFIPWSDTSVKLGKYYFWDTQIIEVGKSGRITIIRLYASQFPKLPI